MRYIRTEDGIYELTENMHITGKHLINSYVNDEDVFGNKDIMFENLGEIIAQADTIEELCDEFIWNKGIIRVDLDKKHFSYENDNYLFKIDDYIIEEGVYGAIWVEGSNNEPILKSVAKMNNERGFDLLKEVLE